MATVQTQQPQPHPAQLGGAVQTYRWQWQGQPVTVTYETLGEGDPVVLLPAFSTVSTRSEMRVLAQQIATQFRAIALDWPGFGDSDRRPFDYCPALYHQFLQTFITDTFTEPVRLIAAGHAAGYALKAAQQMPGACRQLALIAPTWQGPLAVMGLPSTARTSVKNLVRSPLLGQALYALNTTPAFLKWMYSRHVFVDASQLTPEYIGRRYANTQRSGARYAPAAFVTGTLDPVKTHDDFMDYFEALPCPVMVVVAEQAPPSSKAEMVAMANLPEVRSVSLPGSLGLAEEYGLAVAAEVLSFFNED